MGSKTKINWCDSTWNPVTGCLHGCEYCYARKIANQYGGYALPGFRTCHSPLSDESIPVGGENVKERWIAFYDASGHELCAITMRGMVQGEIYATIALLAYENGISASEINFAEVTR